MPTANRDHVSARKAPPPGKTMMKKRLLMRRDCRGFKNGESPRCHALPWFEGRGCRWVGRVDHDSRDPEDFEKSSRFERTPDLVAQGSRSRRQKPRDGEARGATSDSVSLGNVNHSMRLVDMGGISFINRFGRKIDTEKQVPSVGTCVSQQKRSKSSKTRSRGSKSI